MKENIPEPSSEVFSNGIRHPKLFLWDAWSYEEDGVIHLYCLAVSRFKKDGTAIQPEERNFYPFHMRHFSSVDEGNSWKDQGHLLTASPGEGRHDSRSIWSGSIERLADGRKLVAYTGLSELGNQRTFLQNIALAISKDGNSIAELGIAPLSSPVDDWDKITQQGYFLDIPERIGHKDGENGGPILAWRDPYIFIDAQQRIHLFWAAKITALKNAMAHALLEKEGSLFRIAKLYPPTTLPDGEEFTQLELPKIHFDKLKGIYYLIVSSCNRLYEGQADDEVDKCVRLYKATSLDGPWEPWGVKGSIVIREEHLFGLTVIKTDFENDRLLCMAPYTDAASEQLSLSFAKAFYINLNPVELLFP